MFTLEQKCQNLNLVNRFLGWGSPRNSLWFIGLEEGQRRTKENLQALQKFEEEFSAEVSTGAAYFWQTHKMMQKTVDFGVGTLNKAEESVLGKLCADSVAFAEKSQDVRSLLWQHGFHCNLYPLGHQRAKTFPKDEYSALFGVSSTQDSIFRQAVTERFGWIRDLRIDSKPKAIICFGLNRSSQLSFEEALKLKRLSRVPLGAGTKGNYGVCLGSNTIIVSHGSGSWSGRLFEGAKADLVSLLRDEWKVRLV
jgi:hypothetical protein